MSRTLKRSDFVEDIDYEEALEERIKKLEDLLTEIIDNKNEAYNHKELFDCMRSIGKADRFLNPISYPKNPPPRPKGDRPIA